MANTLEERLKRAIYNGSVKYLEYDKFTDSVKIGSGSFGPVFRYERKDYELTVVLKCFKIDTSSNEKIVSDFINKLKLLRKVDCHQNIISFYGITKDFNGYYNMIFQHADDGNLREYLKENFMTLQWTTKLRIAREIALGLLFLHDNDIIHKSLHPENILIHQGKPKIDFGLSNAVAHRMPVYTDPQCFNDQRCTCNKKSDVYSLGMILWEISSGIPPFQSFTSKYSLVHHISKGNREDPIEGSPLQYVKLYKQCWDENPNIRPEMKIIVETLDKFIPNEILNRHLPNEFTFSNQQGNINLNSQHNSQHNSVEIHEITVSSLVDQNIRADKRKEAPHESHEITESSFVNGNLLANKKKKVSHEIHETTASLPSSSSILVKKRKEAHKCLNEGRYIEALEIYEEILMNSQHSIEDQKNASTWDLSCRCGFGRIYDLVKAINKSTTLTSLKLNINRLRPNAGKALANALCNNTTLTSLDLYYNKLGLEGGKALAEALYKNTTLTSLALGSNQIGPEGGKALAKALCKNTTLTSLIIFNNNLGLEGVKALSDALCKNTTLTSLNLDRNEVCSKGGEALAEVLCKNTTLTSLDLYRNRLGAKGGKALAYALCKNNTLTSLDLCWNNLGPGGGKAFANTLCENNTLKELNLQNNNMGSNAGKEIANALCMNTTLISLNLDQNWIQSKGGEALSEALRKNNTLKKLVIDTTVESDNPNIEILQYI